MNKYFDIVSINWIIVNADAQKRQVLRNTRSPGKSTRVGWTVVTWRGFGWDTPETTHRLYHPSGKWCRVESGV